MAKVLLKQSKEYIASAILYLDAEFEDGGALLPLNAVWEVIYEALVFLQH